MIKQLYCYRLAVFLLDSIPKLIPARLLKHHIVLVYQVIAIIRPWAGRKVTGIQRFVIGLPISF